MHHFNSQNFIHLINSVPQHSSILKSKRNGLGVDDVSLSFILNVHTMTMSTWDELLNNLEFLQLKMRILRLLQGSLKSPHEILKKWCTLCIISSSKTITFPFISFLPLLSLPLPSLLFWFFLPWYVQFRTAFVLVYTYLDPFHRW